MSTRHTGNRRKFIQRTLAAGMTFGVATACRTPETRGGNSIDPGKLRRFGATLKGRVILPNDLDYESARRVFFWNPRTQRRPVMVARCAQSDDVLRTVEFARRHDLEIAVRGGGHSHLGWSTTDGVVIDLSGMTELVIDQGQHIARFGGGILGRDIVRMAGTCGLAPVLGQCPGVGAAGVTLGGGLGWLSGLYGSASDNLISATIVTADGRLLSANADTNPDLFWALRGGGGNFGVTTALACRLYPVSSVLAGDMDYPVQEAPAVLRFFREVMAEAPDAFQATLNLTPGERGVYVSLCHAGDAAEADRMLRSFRRVATPLRETVKRQSFGDLAGIASSLKPAPFNYIQSFYRESISDDVIEMAVDRLTQAPPGAVIGLSHYMHGAVCRVAPDATSFSLRQAGGIHLRIGLGWDDSNLGERLMAWADTSTRLLRAAQGERIYANYQTYEGPGSAEAVFAGNHPRLVTVKKQYDPTNTFHRNSNIQPRAAY